MWWVAGIAVALLAGPVRSQGDDESTSADDVHVEQPISSPVESDHGTISTIEVDRVSARVLEVVERVFGDVRPRPEALRADLLTSAWATVRQAAAEIGRPALRRRVLDRARARAEAIVGGWPDAEPGLVAVAIETQHRRDVLALEDEILCSCPKEKWTRTLAGCFEVCANGQKSFIDEQLRLGYVPSEVRERMVDSVGTRNVLVGARNPLLGVVAPYLIFVFAALIGLVALLASRRRRAVDAGERSAIDPDDAARLDAELAKIDE